MEENIFLNEFEDNFEDLHENEELVEDDVQMEEETEEDPYFNERNLLNAEKAQLMSNLAANTSSIGDWKIMKIYEARMRGAEDPYDFDALVLQRQSARDRIQEINVELNKLDGIEPTEAEILAMAKSRKQNDITEYDNSANVNSFIIGGEPMWLNFDQRSRLKASLEAIEADGGTEMTKSFGGKSYTFTTQQWHYMINAVENYAGDCQTVTETHRINVNNLESVDEVNVYDYTVGYPQKINFDKMFSNE